MNFRRLFLTQIGIDLGIAIALAALIFFIGSDISHRSGRIASLKNNISSRNQVADSLAALHRDLDRTESYSVELQNLLPNRDELLNFSRDLNIIANQNKVSLNSSLGREEKSEGERLGRVNFNLTAEGAIDNILSFLKAVKNSRYLIEAGSFDLAAKTVNNFRLSLNGHVFSFYSR